MTHPELQARIHRPMTGYPVTLTGSDAPMASNCMIMAGTRMYIDTTSLAMDTIVEFALQIPRRSQALRGRARVAGVQVRDHNMFQPAGSWLEFVEFFADGKAAYERHLERLLDRQTVADFMQTRVVSINADAKLHQAVTQLQQAKVGALPVLNGANDVIGILSERDILMILKDGRIPDISVDDAMTADPVTIPAQAPLAQAVEVIAKGQFRHLPVTQNSRLVGMISARDLQRSWQAILDWRWRQLQREHERAQSLLIHDLRSPLATIQSATYLLMGNESDKEFFFEEKFADVIQQRCAQMLRLIDELLTIAEIDVGAVSIDPREFDLFDFVRTVVTAFRGNAKAKDISLELRGEPVQVWADPHRIEEVVQNLVSNALKFSPPGSIVQVSVQPDGHAQAALTVKDNGPGIPKIEQEQVFEEFAKISTQPTAGEPTSGLGLAITRKLAELHGGTIKLISDAGEGCEFIVTLPQHKQIEDR